MRHYEIHPRQVEAGEGGTLSFTRTGRRQEKGPSHCQTTIRKPASRGGMR